MSFCFFLFHGNNIQRKQEKIMSHFCTLKNDNRRGVIFLHSMLLSELIYILDSCICYCVFVVIPLIIIVITLILFVFLIAPPRSLSLCLFSTTHTHKHTQTWLITKTGNCVHSATRHTAVGELITLVASHQCVTRVSAIAVCPGEMKKIKKKKTHDNMSQAAKLVWVWECVGWKRSRKKQTSETFHHVTHHALHYHWSS